jgi:hypothetical protein
MGYYDYQQGLIYRHLRQGAGWNHHLGKTRAFILESINHCKPGAVTVLGSGWLLDLPLAEMSERVRDIYLVDVIHPPGVAEQVKKLGNISLMEMDITGGLIGEAWKRKKKYRVFKRDMKNEKISVPVFCPGFDTGLVISLNILTQLEILPLRFLEKNTRVTGSELNDLRREIQQKHLDFLARRESVLITDTAEIFTDRQGNVSEKQSVIIDLPGGARADSWIWNFDMKRTDFYRKRSVMKVVAILF